MNDFGPQYEVLRCRELAPQFRQAIDAKRNAPPLGLAPYIDPKLVAALPTGNPW